MSESSSPPSPLCSEVMKGNELIQDLMVSWDVKVTYYLFAFEAPIAKMDKRCGMFRSPSQLPQGIQYLEESRETTNFGGKINT